jgi:hypothetical protein
LTCYQKATFQCSGQIKIQGVDTLYSCQPAGNGCRTGWTQSGNTPNSCEPNGVCCYQDVQATDPQLFLCDQRSNTTSMQYVCLNDEATCQQYGGTPYKGGKNNCQSAELLCCQKPTNSSSNGTGNSAPAGSSGHGGQSTTQPAAPAAQSNAPAQSNSNSSAPDHSSSGSTIATQDPSSGQSTCSEVKPSQTEKSKDLSDSVYTWKPANNACSATCNLQKGNADCANYKNTFDDFFATNRDNTAWCYGGFQNSTPVCLQLVRNVCKTGSEPQCKAQARAVTPIPTNAPPPACDSNKVAMRVSSSDLYVGDKVTFIAEPPPGISDYQGSTDVDDRSLNSFTDCNFNQDHLGFYAPNTQTCTITKAGSFNWIHSWKNCRGTDTRGNVIQTNCTNVCSSNPLAINVNTGTPPPPLPQPINLRASCVKTGSVYEIKFSWDDPSSKAVKYAVRVDHNDNGLTKDQQGQLIDSEDKILDDYNGNAYSKVVLVGQPYAWWVHSIDDRGQYSQPGAHGTTTTCTADNTTEPPPPDVQTQKADVDGNGTVDIADLNLCKREINGIDHTKKCDIAPNPVDGKVDILDWSRWIDIYHALP